MSEEKCPKCGYIVNQIKLKMDSNEIWHKVYRTYGDLQEIETVLKNGIPSNKHFVKNLQDALIYGKYVVVVVLPDSFFKVNAPDFWSNPLMHLLKNLEPIPASQISAVWKINLEEIYMDKKLFNEEWMHTILQRHNIIQSGCTSLDD
jgi:hypothetical protein